MLAGIIYFILYKQVTGSTAGQDKCATKFGCGATPFKRIITGKWQEGSKGKSEAKTTRSSNRLADIAKQEQTADKGTPAKKPKIKKTAKKARKNNDNDDEEEDN